MFGDALLSDFLGDEPDIFANNSIPDLKAVEVTSLLPRPLTRVSTQIALIFFGLVFVLGLMSNTFLIVIIWVAPGRSSDRSKLLFTIRATSDLLKLLIVTPAYAYSISYHDWQLGNVLCHLMGFCTTLFEAFSILMCLTVLVVFHQCISLNSNWRGAHGLQVQLYALTRRMTTVILVISCSLALGPGLVNQEVHSLFQLFHADEATDKPSMMMSNSFDLKPLLNASTFDYFNPFATNLNASSPHGKIAKRYCSPVWPHPLLKLAYYMVVLLTLYLLPLIVMIKVCYDMRTQLHVSNILSVPPRIIRRRRVLIRSFVAMNCVFAVSWFFSHLIKVVDVFIDVHLRQPFIDLGHFSICLSMASTVTNPVFAFILSTRHQKMLSRIACCRRVL